MLLGVAALVLPVLTYFAGVGRGRQQQRDAERHAEKLQREEWNRADALRRSDASSARIEKLVSHVQWLLSSAGGSHGVHLETVQVAGVRALSEDEIRLALRELALHTPIVIPEAEWKDLEDVSLRKVFHAAQGRVNLSGGPPSFTSVVARFKQEGIDISRSQSDVS